MKIHLFVISWHGQHEKAALVANTLGGHVDMNLKTFTASIFAVGAASAMAQPTLCADVTD